MAITQSQGNVEGVRHRGTREIPLGSPKTSLSPRRSEKGSFRFDTLQKARTQSFHMLKPKPPRKEQIRPIMIDSLETNRGQYMYMYVYISIYIYILTKWKAPSIQSTLGKNIDNKSGVIDSFKAKMENTQIFISANGRNKWFEQRPVACSSLSWRVQCWDCTGKPWRAQATGELAEN